MMDPLSFAMGVTRAESAICVKCQHFRSAGGWLPDGWGRCDRAESSRSNPIDKASLCFGIDNEFYSAGLAVSPNFGCVQFEPLQLETVTSSP